jgi:hypothetical protein
MLSHACIQQQHELQLTIIDTNSYSRRLLNEFINANEWTAHVDVVESIEHITQKYDNMVHVLYLLIFYIIVCRHKNYSLLSHNFGRQYSHGIIYIIGICWMNCEINIINKYNVHLLYVLFIFHNVVIFL